MQPASDAESTLRDAQSGSREAFASIVRQHQSMVFSVLWNFLHNEGVAEELAQDVFLELHRTLASLESPAHVAHWLRRVAAHRAIDYSRREANRPKLALEDIAEPAAQDETSDPMLAATLRRLTALLPEKARAVVILRFQEDLEPAEIADVLAMPVNTVKSHLQRSLAMLRKRLERTQVRQ